MAETVQVVYWRRWWRAVQAAFRTDVYAKTDYETQLEADVSRARDEIGDLKRELALAREQTEALQSQIRVKDVELGILALVVERDRKRIESELANESAKAARAVMLSNKIMAGSVDNS